MSNSGLLKVVSNNGNGLVTDNNVSHDDVKNVMTLIKEYISSGNDNALQQMTEQLNKSPGLITFLFPSQLHKEYEKLKVEDLKVLFKGRKQMLETITGFQLTAARHMSEMIINSHAISYESQLSQLAIDKRAELAQYSQKKFDEMSKVFDESRIEFGNRLEILDLECERHKGLERFHLRFKQNIDFTTDLFFDIIEDLYEGVRTDLKNKLSKYVPS